MTKYFLAMFVAVVAFAQTAHAENNLRGEVFCFPAEDVPKIVDNLKEVDKDRRDIVDVNINPKFIIKDGGAWPERFFIRTETAEIDMPVKKPSGVTPTFLKQAYAHKDGDVCVADKTRAMKPEYDEGLYFEMGLSPLYHNSTGRHDMAELKEGTKDGKKFYEKMIPSVARLFMPDSDYLAVKYNDMRTTGAQIFALVNKREVPLTAELYKEMHVVSYDDLEEMGAEALIIKGGAYRLQPTVSVKTMKRFGWGQDEDDT